MKKPNMNIPQFSVIQQISDLEDKVLLLQTELNQKNQIYIKNNQQIQGQVKIKNQLGANQDQTKDFREKIGEKIQKYRLFEEKIEIYIQKILEQNTITGELSKEKIKEKIIKTILKKFGR
jgi:ABC-type polar amino acid transport system ATPase subunit